MDMRKLIASLAFVLFSITAQAAVIDYRALLPAFFTTNGGYVGINGRTVPTNISDLAHLTGTNVFVGGSNFFDQIFVVKLVATNIVGIASATNGIYGKPNNSNMDQLYKFYGAIGLGTRPVRTLAISDLGAYPGGGGFGQSFQGLLGNIGGISAGGAVDGTMNLSLANVSQTIDTTTWGLGSGLYQITNGSTMTWSRRSVGFPNPGTRETNWLATKAVIWYLAETNAGTFKVQTNINGGGWNDMQTINAAAFGTNGMATNFSFASDYYSLRVIGLTGTNRIIDAGIWNDAKNGYLGIGSAFTITSRSISNVMTCPTNVLYPIFKSANPDLIMVMDTDVASSPPAWVPFNQMITNCCTNADVVLCGNHFAGVNDPTNALVFNVEAITNAITFGWGYFDTWGYLGTNVVDQTNHLILAADGVHFTTAGADYMNGKLFDAIMHGLVIADPWHNDQIFQGAEVNLLNSARTDPLGIGTVFPDKNTRVDVELGNTAIKFAQQNQSAEIFMQGNYAVDTSTSTNVTFMMDVNGGLYIGPGWPPGAGNMGNIYFGQPFPGKGLGTWFADGDFVLGPSSGLVDPGGQWNFQANNIVSYFGSKFIGSGAGITNISGTNVDYVPGVNVTFTTNNHQVAISASSSGTATATNSIVAILTNGVSIGAVVITNLNLIGNGITVTGAVSSGQANVGFTGGAFTGNTTQFASDGSVTSIVVGVLMTNVVVRSTNNTLKATLQLTNDTTAGNHSRLALSVGNSGDSSGFNLWFDGGWISHGLSGDAGVTNISNVPTFFGRGDFLTVQYTNIGPVHVTTNQFTTTQSAVLLGNGGYGVNSSGNLFSGTDGFWATNATRDFPSVHNATITTTSNYNAGYISYATNQSQIQPDFSIPFQLMSTNAAFTFLAPKGVDANKKTVQTCAIYVTNTTASVIVVTPPANCHGVGPMNVTNLTRFTVECYAGAFTNMFSAPVF